jgi:DNA replication protein
MKSKSILNYLRSKDLVIPNVLLFNRKSLNLDEKEIIFLSYLISYKGDILFDINSFSKELNYSEQELMVIVSSLCDKSYIDMKVQKKDNKMTEYLDINVVFNKMMLHIINDEEEINEDYQTEIYEKIEKEFGRTLSPIEYETIKSWIDAKIPKELIFEALREAVLNGVTNLKYIDKILYEWNKKGYKSKKDCNIKNKKEEVIEDLFDYDWLDEK